MMDSTFTLKNTLFIHHSQLPLCTHGIMKEFFVSGRIPSSNSVL